jgi:hypothetical protein
VRRACKAVSGPARRVVGLCWPLGHEAGGRWPAGCPLRSMHRIASRSGRSRTLVACCRRRLFRPSRLWGPCVGSSADTACNMLGCILHATMPGLRPPWMPSQHFPMSPATCPAKVSTTPGALHLSCRSILSCGAVWKHPLPPARPRACACCGVCADCAAVTGAEHSQGSPLAKGVNPPCASPLCASAGVLY